MSHPLQLKLVRMLSSSSPGRRSLYCYILPAVSLASLLNLGKFFETETVTYCMDFTSCGCGKHLIHYAKPTELRLSKDYTMWYCTWTWIIMTSVAPFVILTTFNLVIWRRLNEGRTRLRETKCSTNSYVMPVAHLNVYMKTHWSSLQVTQQMVKEKKLCLSSTTILVCTVSMFLASNLPRLSLSLYEAANINRIVVCQYKNKSLY